jgi:hypothetical protein
LISLRPAKVAKVDALDETRLIGSLRNDEKTSPPRAI